MDINARMLLDLLQAKHSQDVFVPECNTGSAVNGCQRMDALAMKKSWAHPLVTGYEIKVSRSDFVRDTKWHNYLPFCNAFYFVTPPGIIDKSEVPEDAGWMVCAKTGSRLFTKKKSPYRDVRIPEEVFRYILFSRAQIVSHTRTDDRRNDAAFWSEWLESKQFTSELGHRVSRALREVIAREITTLRVENEMLKRENAKLEQVRHVLKELGFSDRVPSEWAVEDRIKERLNGGVYRRILEKTQREATRLASSIDDVLESCGCENEGE